MDTSSLGQGDVTKAIMDDSLKQLLQRLDLFEIPESNSTRSQIDRNIATLEEVLCFYTGSIRALQSELRRRQNEIALINQLPMEIVLHIIFFAVGGWDEWDIHSVLRMMTVCKTWREVISHQPSLWCHIYSYQRPLHNQRVLKHNQTGPLGVSSTSKGWLQRHIEISHPSRWKTIRYRGLLFPELTEALRVAIRLRDLCIAADSEWDADGLPQVTIPNPSHLHSLDLGYVTLPWPSLLGVRLEVLALQGLRQQSPSANDIFSILSSSPNLRRLVLILLNPVDGAAPSLPINTSIPLPRLHTVSIQSVPQAFSRAVLDALDAPGCKALDISDCHPVQFQCRSKSAMPATIKSVLKTATRVIVSYISQDDSEGRAGKAIIIETNPEVRIRTMERPAVHECPGLNMTVPLHEDGDWRNVVESLELGRRPSNLTVRFRSFPGEEAEKDELLVRSWVAALGDGGAAFEGMDFDSMFDSISILRYLSSPQVDESDGPYWPCPQLKTINVLGTTAWSEAQNDELEQACIAFLRRSSSIQQGLTPPKQVEEMFIYRGRIPSTLESMGEFSSVRFSPSRVVLL